MSSSGSVRPAGGHGTNGDEGLRFALEAARIASENRTEQVAVLDLRGLSSLADYFVIGTGTSDRQMHAVLDRLEQHAESLGRRPLNISGSRSASWILADYVDVVIHLFDAEHREYYDLDGLWGDAPRIDWAARPEPDDPAANVARPSPAGCSPAAPGRM